MLVSDIEFKSLAFPDVPIELEAPPQPDGATKVLSRHTHNVRVHGGR